MARSKRRRDAIRHRRVAFNDSRDSIRERSFGWGVAAVPTSRRLPPPGAYRSLSRVEDLALPNPLTLMRARIMSGYGADQPHVASPSRSRFGGVGVTAGVRVGPSPRPLQAIRRSTWDFGALEVPVPPKVKFCVRRKQRRETLFALDIAGRRGLGVGGVRRTPSSAWSC